MVISDIFPRDKCIAAICPSSCTVTDKTIDENDKMSMFSTYISGNTFGNYVYNDGVGYYNLDYMGSDVKLFEY